MINMRDEVKYKICLILKVVQFLFVLLVVMLEIAQVITFTQFFQKLVAYLSRESDTYYSYSTETGVLYYDSPMLYDSASSRNSAELYFTNSSVGKGPTVIWVFIVMIISVLSLIGYFLLFSEIWNFRKQIIFIGFDAAFVILWLTEVFANFIWIYNGVKSPCYLTRISDYYSFLVSVYLPELKTVCGAYNASNVFGWFVLSSSVISLAFSFNVYKEANKEAPTNQINQFNANHIDNIDNTNNMTGILQPSQQIRTPLRAESLQDESSRAESLQELPKIGEPSSAA